MIAAFVQNVVFADSAVRGCLSGPDPANGRSIRVLEKAGFERGEIIETTGLGAGPELIMRRRR